MLKLIRNEVLKILLKRKMLLISFLLILFIGLFAYGEKYAYERTIDRFEISSDGAAYDWTSLANQRLDDLERRMASPYANESSNAYMAIEIEQLTYFIENDINPITPSAARFSVEFIEQGIIMFIPLLIVILAADLVSGELANRTIKILLTRAVPRWRILLSKLLALYMMTTIVVLIVGLLATLISGMFFGAWGFDEPVATGFKIINGALNSDAVIRVSRGYYTILIYALAWFVSLIIASITLMISVMVKSTSSAIGIVMASLIGGQFLQFFLSDWALVKYFFVSNLNLTKYLTGTYQQIEGMSLNFSIVVLGIWAILALILSFIVFITRDVLV